MTALPEATVNNTLTELSVDQMDALDNPQTIYRQKGAKYILELERFDGQPVCFEEMERTREVFNAWWASDAPFLIVQRPVRVSVIVLPAYQEPQLMTKGED